MSADVLREAAQLMREHNPPCCGVGDVCCQGVALHHALATWLDKEADGVDLMDTIARVALAVGADVKLSHSTHAEALVVAHIYLGRA